MFLVEERRRNPRDFVPGSLSIDLHLTCGTASESGRNDLEKLTEEGVFHLEDAVPTLTHGDTSCHNLTTANDKSDTERKIADVAEFKLGNSTQSVLALTPRLNVNSLSPFISVNTYCGRASLLPGTYFPTSELCSTQYLSIVACGPAGMCDQARAGAIQTISEGSWKRVQFTEECYSW